MDKIVENGTWIVEKTTHLDALDIASGASVVAPEGKFITLTVDGVGYPLEPGKYRGDIWLTACDEFIRSSLRFGEETVSSFHAGVCINDGKVLENSSVFPIVNHGDISDKETVHAKIESREWDFNGFYITGKSEYRIADTDIHLYGDGTDDFVGMGAAISAAGESKVTIDNCNVKTEGIGRGTLFVGEHAEVTMNDCTFSTVSHVPTPEEMEAGAKLQRMMEPPWAIGLRGNGRTLNVAGHGKLNINRSHLTSNNWGVCSVDGAIVNRMNIKDSLIEITGDNGYGCFSICDDFMFDYKAFGDYGCYDTVDHSTFNVAYTGILMSLGNSSGEFKNGSIVNSKRFGAFIHRNSGGILKVNSGSAFKTGASCVVVKGSNTYFEFDNAILEPGNGTILQLQDNDDVGMGEDVFLVPVSESDVRDDRDLTVAIPDEDVFVKMSNMETAGNLYNSTTNLMACNRRLPPDPNAPYHPPVPEIPMGPDRKPVLRGFQGEDLMGAKNLDVQLINVRLTGEISAATAAYKEGLTQIRQSNCEELSNITQTPAAPINNGVIVSVDAQSTWTVTGTCYLTKLTLEDGGTICAADGKVLKLTVDGAETALQTGVYTGIICLTVE